MITVSLTRSDSGALAVLKTQANLFKPDWAQSMKAQKVSQACINQAQYLRQHLSSDWALECKYSPLDLNFTCLRFSKHYVFTHEKTSSSIQDILTLTNITSLPPNCSMTS